MMFSRFKDFRGRQDGSTTIEFIVLFVGFVSLMFFVTEIALYTFFVATLEKAAEAGVRMAATSRPMIGSVPLTNLPSSGGKFGDSCINNDGDRACDPFSTVSCTGSACQADPFDKVLNHMRGFNGLIAAENVTVTYSDVGIGFAGGPTVPMITVTVSGVPFQTGVARLLLTDIGSSLALPSRSASMTGEDLAP